MHIIAGAVIQQSCLKTLSLQQIRHIKKYMNKYNVIHLDISSFWDDYKANIIEKIKEYVVSDLRDEFEENVDFSKKFSVILMSVYKLTGIQFVIIIDEWDCVIRNSDDQNLIHNYLQFLHSLFKSEESKVLPCFGIYNRDTSD